MRKLILGFALLAAVLTACAGKKNAETIIGSWVMPIEGQPGKVQGLKLEEGGVASSINMATLVYQSWEQQGDKLYLTVKSIGNGMEIEGVDTMNIDRVTADSLILSSNYGYTLSYAKQK